LNKPPSVHPRLWSRVQGFYQRRAAAQLFKKRLVINTNRAIISFTFDDFPRSALIVGGAILSRYGLAGTYYASLGLMDQDAPTGRIFCPEDLTALVEHGHELGCHTFSHCHSWTTDPIEFENSIVENRAALSGLLPGAEFQTFSYPISPPRPLTKARIAKHFLCCRGSGQMFNSGTADLNQLSAYFLEQSRHSLQAVKEMIDRNREGRAWLIFATHDISRHPTAWGCTPAFFSEVVQYAVNSGARIVPVAKALRVLQASGASNQAGEESTNSYGIHIGG